MNTNDFNNGIPRKCYLFPGTKSQEPAMHTALLEYISSGFKDQPVDSFDSFVPAYAIGGEAPQFLHPNSPYFAQEPK